jgi:hypothetical protein
MLLAPLYRILPNEMPAKVYSLRWVMVLMSLATVWIAYRVTTVLFPQRPTLPYVVCLLLAVIPERTASVSRVNNDVLLEIIAAAFIWICTQSVLTGLSTRRSQLLGLLLGLGVLTKTSMGLSVILLPVVFWANRRDPNWRWYALWTGGFAAVLIAPLVARNLWLYGDLTGFAGYERLRGPITVAVTWQSSISAALDLFRHFWLVWWKGVKAMLNPVISVFYLFLGGLSTLSLVGIMRRVRQQGKWTKRNLVILMYLLAIGCYTAAILASYFAGDVPVIQGRFLLPVIVPAAILFSWGLWQSPHRKTLLLTVVSILVVLSALGLFWNLLPYHYYWSAFAADDAPGPHTSLSWHERGELFYQRFLSDKPAGIHLLLALISLLCLMSLVLAGLSLKKMSFLRPRCHSMPTVKEGTE